MSIDTGEIQQEFSTQYKSHKIYLIKCEMVVGMI